MALKKCKECGNDVSTSAASCPKCGAVIKKKTGFWRYIVGAFLIFITLVATLVVIGSLINGVSNTKSTSGSLTTAKPSCDTAKATELISKLKDEGIIYKIDAPPNLYPRVYVTEAWQALPMDQKKVVDGVLYCWGSHRAAKDIIVKYYDYRTEEKIALGGRAGFELQ